MLKTLILVSLLLIFASAARAENLAFVGRTQNTADVPNTSITLATPAGIQNGDVMLVFIASYNSTPTAPAGWTSLGSRDNSNYDVGAAFLRVWQTGNPTSYTFGNVNWPKAIMRVYRGVTGVDSSNFAASGGGASSLTLPALSATTAANDAYIAFFVSDNATAISGPPDLADQTADQTQWGSFDGDKIIASRGTTPPAESASLSYGTGNWVGFAVTLGNNPSPPLLPYGNVPPPSGQSWYVTLDDEFNQDTNGVNGGINTAMWNGGPGGGVPWCTSPNNDALGNSGGSCSQFYGNAFDGTTTPAAPYMGIKPGVGLIVQNLNNYHEAGRGNLFPDQNWISLQNYAKWSQRFGYFEISAKMPTDNNGEGDGLHLDVWLVPVNRTNFSGGAGSDEVDIAENDLGAATTNDMHFNVYDTNSQGQNVNLISLAYPYTAGDLSAAFHRYAVYWRDDGVHGTFQLYFDGQAVGSPVTVNDSLWDAGVYIFPGWMQQVGLGAFYGGADVDQYTSNDNPLIIQYVRVWQSH